MSTSTPASYTPYLTLAAGVAAHLFYFKTGERHLYPLRYVQAFILIFVVSTFANSHYGNISTAEAARSTAISSALFLTGLYSSLIIYRLFFNPLNKFPGPYWARLSKFNLVRRVAPKLNGHHELADLHQKYGKFVRIGPNDLSVTEPEGVEVISGNKSKCTKAPWYNQDVPLISMHTCRDRAQHDRRRRIWSPAFSDKALRGYETRIQVYNDLLIQKMEEHAGQPVDVTKWFNLYSFDVMGDLGFGSGFDMLQAGDYHWAIKVLNEGMAPLGLNLPIWMFRVMTSIPIISDDYQRFLQYTREQLDKRIKMQGKLKVQDITHTLIEFYQKSDHATQRTQLPMLQGDARLIIVAGSDTTAATLTHLFYHIASQKGLAERLRDELDSLLAPGTSFEHAKIQDAKLLNGAINETLRLNPPVPSGVFRQTPKEGVEIAGTYVPGNTCIQMPGYAMARDPDIYPMPLEFIPERFSTRPELIRHKDAFAPFSTGPYGCIGKNLAYLEIRTLASQLLRKFDVALAPGEDGHRLLEESKDHFTLGMGRLDLVFTKRQDS